MDSQEVALLQIVVLTYLDNFFLTFLLLERYTINQQKYGERKIDKISTLHFF